MIASVLEGRADMIFAPLTLSLQRSTAVDYTPSVGVEEHTMLIQRAERVSLSWTLFIQPFHVETWWGIFLIALLSAVVIRVIQMVRGSHEPFKITMVCCCS